MITRLFSYITNNMIDVFETLGTAFNISHGNVLHGLLEFINKNRNSENSKMSQLCKMFQETKVNTDDTKGNWEMETAVTILEEHCEEACE